MHPARSIDAPTLARWSEAARTRSSRRVYMDEPVSGPAADALDAHCAAFAPFPGTRVVLLRRAPAKIFTGWLLGVYGKVASPSALVFVADKRLPGAAARAGYAGEAAVLEATALGLATCWIGGGVKRDVVNRLLRLAAHEHVYSISALGYSPEQPTTGERATAGLVRARARKPREKLAPGAAEWPAWAHEGVELARIAPSATNRQPWRFALERESHEPGPVPPGGQAHAASARADGTVWADPGSPRGGGRDIAATAAPDVRLYFEGKDTPVISKRLDCGIAMLHFELGARNAGAVGSWSLLEGNDVARWVSGQDPPPPAVE